MGGIIFRNQEEREPEREEAKVVETPKSAVSAPVHPPEVSGNLTKEASFLLDFYRRVYEKEQQQIWGPKVKVGETLSSVAHVYERLRYAIDYKKEHLVRRNAIERILKRQLRGGWLKNPVDISEALIKELIWARYLKNDYIPVTKESDVAIIIAKYIKFLALISSRFTQRDEVNWWKGWLISIASCEIEEALDPSLLAIEALSAATESWFHKKYEWVGDGLDEKQKETQLTIAIYRGLFRSDDARTAYHLLKHLYKDWQHLLPEQLDGNTAQIFQIFLDIKASLEVSIQAKLYRFVQKQISAFQVLKEIIEDDVKIATQILSNPKEMEDRVYDVCEEKYEEIGQRVSRGITRSIIYIFITKIIFAIVVEIPYEYFLLGGIGLLPLFTTIFIPILFVLLVAITIKKPGEANTERIMEKLFDFVYVSESEEKTKFSLTIPRSSKFMYQAFAIAYGVVFLLTFGAISYALRSLGFNVVSGAIFFIFLSLVLLFAYRVKYTSSELNVTGERESLLSHLVSNITLPLLDLGVWLSDKFAKFNFFIAFLDFLIEAPLKNVIGVADEWTSFVKERREEVVEVPVER